MKNKQNSPQNVDKDRRYNISSYELLMIETLKNYSDSENPFTQEKLRKKIYELYGMDISRDAMRKKVNDLIALDNELYKHKLNRKLSGIDFSTGINGNIDYLEKTRKSKTDTENDTTIITDLYYVHDFTTSEIDFFIDNVLFCKYISKKQKKELISKLISLSSFNYKPNYSYLLTNLNTHDNLNEELFLNFEIINEAISKGKQIEFNFATYGTDKKLHISKNSDNSNKVYTYHPFRIIYLNAKYYLVGTAFNYNNISFYRMDKIKNVKILDFASSKPKDYDLASILSHQINMYSGDVGKVTFTYDKLRIDNLFDYFSKDMIIKKNKYNPELVTITTKVNIEAFKLWAIQYCQYATVLSPADLRNEISEILANTLQKYQRTHN